MTQTRNPKAMHGNKVGVMWPQSPTGRASLMDLNTEPDLVLSDDVLIVGFRADPEAVRAYVPEPLELDGSGLMYIKAVQRWGYTSRNATEFISFERLNQTESFFWIPCSYEGKEFYFVPFSWGNRDWLGYTGRLVGMPHKWAKVQMTSFHSFHPTYSGAHAGARICASVENMGLVHRIYGDLKEVIRPEDTPFKWVQGSCPHFLGHRYIWDSVKGRPLANDLVAHYGDDVEMGPVWHGDGWAQFYDAENDEVLQFQPREMVGSWFFTLRFTHQKSSPYIVHDYGDQSPYANRPQIKELLGG
ncbi:acetoacetate decarboxylase family protein [Dactylosporangium sp. CA-092794]|uniref:acetoacetate decarboxylase family protein n=1 Tax=Dactylosporangium sp. CA-092794 TaxID=3239929 RepID=UPI003D8B7554